MRWLVHWIINAISLLIVAYIVPGIGFRGWKAVFITALVLGLINATVGAFLKFVTFPLVVLTLGIFWFVINALMILLASKIVSGFYVSGFWAAFWGGILLAVVNTFLRWLMPKRERD